MERDLVVLAGTHNHTYFNSHAHVERDDFCANCEFNGNHFNSHAHVERDVNLRIDGLIYNISTHTLTWSVTSVMNKLLLNA